MDKRAAFRFPTNVEADCRSSNRSWVSRMRNISTTGCMIVCPDDDLPGGALLRMRIKGLTAIDGEIVWLHRGRARGRSGLRAPSGGRSLPGFGIARRQGPLDELAVLDGEVQFGAGGFPVGAF